MKIAVIGAGAIGSLVAGYLKLKGSEISLVGHPAAMVTIKEKGLKISGAKGDFQVKLDIAQRLDFSPDLAILATKTQDLEQALKENLAFLRNALVLTAQNGIQADEIAAKFIPAEKIISSIVMFAATLERPGEVVHNFDGNWIIGKLSGESDAALTSVSRILESAFSVVITDKIKGMKYLKIFLNANNCLPAVLGKSMQEVFSDIEVSRLSIFLWKEGLAVIKGSGIALESLPDFPLERLTKLTSLPILEAARIFSGMMVNLSKEPLYGSVLQSIQRQKPSEIDYLNGEFLNLAQKHRLQAPLNKKLVEMVHAVEKTGKFFRKEDLLAQTKGLVN